MSDDVTSLPRETGSDKSTSKCSVCGTELPSVSTAYGSTTAGACPKCGKDSLSEAEKAMAQETEERGYPAGEPVEDWKAAQLAAYAEDKGIDLSGATTKADMVSRIGEAGQV